MRWGVSVAVVLGWAGLSGANAADLPRLAGIVVAPDERLALFDLGQGTLTRADVGDDVDGFRVQSIDRRGVRLERDGRVDLISPSAARTAPAQPEGAPFGLILRAQPPVDD